MADWATLEVAQAALADPLTQQLSTSMVLHEHTPHHDVFPAERWAHVRVHLRSGAQHDSEPAKPRGNPENALTEDEILVKFFGLADPVIGSARARQIVALVAQLVQSDSALAQRMDLSLAPTARA
jgi:2-methylcitrate dehydratase PrpD